MKHLCTVLVVLVLALFAASRSEAAFSGTAWGSQSGTPTCAGSGTGRICFLHLAAAGGFPGDLTTVACEYPYDTACSQVANGATVIVSVVERAFSTTAYNGRACSPDGNLWEVY